MAFLSVFLLATAVAAAQFDPSLEAEARRIETELIAPCCWSQQVSVHQSAAADEMRAAIRAMLQAGRSRDEILDAFVAQYGERILAVPPARGYKLILYVLPLILLVGSALLLGVIVRRMAGRTALAPAGGAPPPGDVDDQYRDRLANELRNLD
jgi:cytochrome c-type biogenesis protein CcmH/NrfF